jgi:hypothetical protein
VRLVLLLLGALVVVMLVGFVISTLKWLLIAAIVLVAIGLLAGWRPGRTSERSSRSAPRA